MCLNIRWESRVKKQMRGSPGLGGLCCREGCSILLPESVTLLSAYLASAVRCRWCTDWWAGIVLCQKHLAFVFPTDWAFLCECGALRPQRKQEDLCRFPRRSESPCCPADALGGPTSLGKWQHWHWHAKTIRRASHKGPSRGVVKIPKAGCALFICDGTEKPCPLDCPLTIGHMGNSPYPTPSPKKILKSVSFLNDILWMSSGSFYGSYLLLSLGTGYILCEWSTLWNCFGGQSRKSLNGKYWEWCWTLY